MLEGREGVMKTLAGRVAVVTGGASGIGLGLVRRFIAEGMRVVIADVNRRDLDAAVATFVREGADVLGQPTDVSDPAQVQSLARVAVARFGSVHVLCNNAGVGAGFQRFGNVGLAAWEWIVGVNLWGVVHGCREFLPILSAQEEAHIVNTASIAGFTYSAFHHPYNVTKAGVVALTEGLHRELKAENSTVGVSVLCPGAVNTRIVSDERNAPAGVPLARLTDPDLEGLRHTVEESLLAGQSPDEVAGKVVAALRSGALHIFTHPEWLPAVQQRMSNVLSGQPLADRFSGGVMKE
jgi:NAD(P)-dependent dehydrogenase (short-subunit alcohol dehydrogenase family)